MFTKNRRTWRIQYIVQNLGTCMNLWKYITILLYMLIMFFYMTIINSSFQGLQSFLNYNESYHLTLHYMWPYKQRSRVPSESRNLHLLINSYYDALDKIVLINCMPNHGGYFLRNMCLLKYWYLNETFEVSKYIVDYVIILSPMYGMHTLCDHSSWLNIYIGVVHDKLVVKKMRTPKTCRMMRFNYLKLKITNHWTSRSNKT